MKWFFDNISQGFLDPDRIPVAMMAWLLVGIAGLITGPMHGNANPFLWLILDKTFGKIGARLDRKERKRADLIVRGFFLTLAGALVVLGMGVFAADLAAARSFYGVTEVFFLALALTGGSVWFSLLQLYFAMRDKKVSKGAYYAIARSTRADLSGSDDYGITRAGMGLAARSFDKGLVAPVFWYLIGGLPGAYLYAALAAISWRFSRDGFTAGFGVFALRLEKLAGFAPNILSGVLMALAGLFTPTGGMTRALIGQLFGKEKAKYEEGGLPVTAMAFSLGVTLGGPAVDLDGISLKKAWVGPKGASARLEEGHLRRALYIGAMAHLLFMASLAGGLFWAGRLF